jgi:hypothetical protein
LSRSNQKNFYERDVRAGATRDQSAQVDTLLRSAERLIEGGGTRDLDLAGEQIIEVS